MSAASAVRPSETMRASFVELHVVVGAREAGAAGGRLDRAAAGGVRRDGDVRLGEYPQHVVVAVVGGADARCPSCVPS